MNYKNFYHIVIKRDKTIYHIVSHVPISLDKMASLNSKHDEEKFDYHYDVISIEELRMIAGYKLGQWDWDNDDFAIFEIRNELRNRMDGAPDWVIRNPRNDYYYESKRFVAGGRWEC